MWRYAEFRLCREMGWTPEQVRSQPADLVLEWLSFLSAEGDAQRRLQEAAMKEAQGRGRARQ